MSRFCKLPCGGIGVDSDTVWNESYTPMAAQTVGFRRKISLLTLRMCSLIYKCDRFRHCTCYGLVVLVSSLCSECCSIKWSWH